MQLLMMPLKKKQLIKRMPETRCGADSTQDVYFYGKDSNLVRNQIDEKTVVYLDFLYRGSAKKSK